MRARVTFLEKTYFNYGGGKLMWGANVQGCLDRSGWSLCFTADVALTDLAFEGEVRWMAEPKDTGLASGTKFQYINPASGEPFALGVVL